MLLLQTTCRKAPFTNLAKYDWFGKSKIPAPQTIPILGQFQLGEVSVGEVHLADIRA
jgi:hypothetical protein